MSYFCWRSSRFGGGVVMERGGKQTEARVDVSIGVRAGSRRTYAQILVNISLTNTTVKRPGEG
jgi:hypothetical protein